MDAEVKHDRCHGKPNYSCPRCFVDDDGLGRRTRFVCTGATPTAPATATGAPPATADVDIRTSVVGVKFDAGKPPLGLIPRSALLAEAEVLAFGAKKYNKHNWRGGMDWSRLLDAVLRHVQAFNEGEDLDPETGRSHLAHARCCLGFLIEYQERALGTDDRFKVAQ